MNWEPWTGCYPVSDGCDYCYFYDPYAKRHGQNTIQKTDKFRSISRVIGKPLSSNSNGCSQGLVISRPISFS